MKRLILLLMGLLLVAPSAMAANDVNWLTLGTDRVNNSASAGTCRYFEFTTTLNTGETVPVFVGPHIKLVVTFEPDMLGANTDGSSAIFYCQTPDANRDGTQDTTACRAANWSVNGAAFSNVLDGTTAGRGGQSFNIPGWFYMDTTAGTGRSRVQFCTYNEG